MIASLVAVYKLILPGFRAQFFALVGLSVIVAILDMVGIASIMPFIAVMVDPRGMMHNRFLAGMLAAIGFAGTPPPIYLAGAATVTLFAFSNGASLFLSWWSAQYAARLAITLSVEFAYRQLGQPFEYFLVNAPAQLANQTCGEIIRFSVGGVVQLCAVVVRAIQLVLVVALLLLISPLFSAAFFLVMAALYGLIYRYSATHIGSAGSEASRSSDEAAEAATEMYALAREILLHGNPIYFVARTRSALEVFYKADAVSRVLPSVPKYALEVIAVCVLFALPIYRSLTGQDARTDLPILATFAYSGFRLLPVIQQMYSSLAILKFHHPLAERLRRAFLVESAAPVQEGRLDRMPASIAFRGVTYSYPCSGAPALSQASFEISRGDTVVVVGPSGSGKSTLVDIVLGLIAPQAGTIVVGDASHSTTRLQWAPGVVGYVPQSPLIFNDTIARNIAFGLEDRNIDFERCREAARRAEIIDLIDAQKSGLQARIGSNVMNFSGGERQRLAIARALYSNPALIVLDEPASALDPPTSRRLFDLLCSSRLNATVIVVTHAVEYVPEFHKVIFVQNGGSVTSGTYVSLMTGCAEFREFLSQENRTRGVDFGLDRADSMQRIVSPASFEPKGP